MATTSCWRRIRNGAGSRARTTRISLIYRVMREPEQRITALLNGEIQIAQFVPPHLASRIEASSRHHIVTSGSIEMMFLAMMPKRKPWDSKELRQAVAYAIDREAIIKTVLQGQGRVLHGPLSRGQYAYDPNLEPKYSYDPEKARALVKQAGFPERRRCRAVHAGRPLHQRQAGLGGDGGDASRRRHPRRAEDARVADAMVRRAEGQGAVLLHGPRPHDQRRAGDFPVFRNR